MQCCLARNPSHVQKHVFALKQSSAVCACACGIRTLYFATRDLTPDIAVNGAGLFATVFAMCDMVGHSARCAKSSPVSAGLHSACCPACCRHKCCDRGRRGQVLPSTSCTYHGSKTRCDNNLPRFQRRHANVCLAVSSFCVRCCLHSWAGLLTEPCRRWLEWHTQSHGDRSDNECMLLEDIMQLPAAIILRARGQGRR